MPIDPEIPPILEQAKGMHVTRVGTTPRGHPFVVLRSPRGEVRELIITVTTSDPATWLFGYVIKDHKTKTMHSYHGPYGDPDRDEPGNLSGFE